MAALEPETPLDEAAAKRNRVLDQIRAGAYREGRISYELHHVARMTRPGELRLLRHLAEHWVRPGQQIVDAGTFLGASTIAIGDGLRARPDAERFSRAVHCYDLFLNSSDFYDRFFDGTVPPGESFLPVFLGNIDHHSRFVNVYPGNFAAFRWIGLPIGLFFCDIAKNSRLNAHVYREFAPCWVPGETVFIQQDFVHAEAPWVHVALGFLRDHFSFLRQETPSLALLLEAPIPDWKLERLQSNDFTLAEQLGALDRLAELPLDHEASLTLRIIAAKILARAGDPEAARRIIGEVREAAGEIDNVHFDLRLRKAEEALSPYAATASDSVVTLT